MNVICTLDKPDMERFNDLTTRVFVVNILQEYGVEQNALREKLKRLWRDFGYRYNFKVREVTINTNGEVFND